MFVYKSLKGLSPQYIQDSLVVKRPPEQAVRTRSAQATSFLVPKFRKCAGERAFSVVATRLWNSLPMSIQNASSLQSFKSMFKTHLFLSLLSCYYFLFCTFPGNPALSSLRKRRIIVFAFSLLLRVSEFGPCRKTFTPIDELS